MSFRTPTPDAEFGVLRLVISGRSGQRTVDPGDREVVEDRWHYCNSLQPIAAYCRLLRITADYCGLLRIIADYCGLLRIIADYCGLLQIIADYCGLLL
jgi:hypothetical protein